MILIHVNQCSTHCAVCVASVVLDLDEILALHVGVHILGVKPVLHVVILHSGERGLRRLTNLEMERRVLIIREMV